MAVDRSEVDPHVDRALSAFNDHDLDRYMDQYAEDATFRDPLAGEIGTARLREYVVELFEAFPDARIVPERFVEDGDVTVVEIAYRGTQRGPYEGIPPTGESVDLPAVLVVTTSEAGITHRRDYWDQQSFRAELGLTFPAVLGHVPRFVRWTLRERL